MSYKTDEMLKNKTRVPLFWRARCARSGDFRRRKIRPLAAALFIVCAFVLPISAVAQKSAANPTADLPSGTMQVKATTSCTECHEARIIVQQRLSKAAWTREVDKMIKWGALVDASDRDALIDYLSTNFNPDQPAYEPPRSAVTGKK
jgi:hypothetical protein